MFFRTTDEMLGRVRISRSEKAYEVVGCQHQQIADMIDTIAPVPEGTFPPKMEGAEMKSELLPKAERGKYTATRCRNGLKTG